MVWIVSINQLNSYILMVKFKHSVETNWNQWKWLILKTQEKHDIKALWNLYNRVFLKDRFTISSIFLIEYQTRIYFEYKIKPHHILVDRLYFFIQFNDFILIIFALNCPEFIFHFKKLVYIKGLYYIQELKRKSTHILLLQKKIPVSDIWYFLYYTISIKLIDFYNLSFSFLWIIDRPPHKT